MIDHAALIVFASLLRKLVQTFGSHGFSADLNATYLLRIARDKLPKPIKLKWTKHVVYNDWTNPGLTELSDWMNRQSRAFEQLQDTFISTTNNHSGQQNPPQGSCSFNNRNKNQNRTNWTQIFPRSKSSNPSNKNFEHNSTANRNHNIAKPQQSTANSSNNTKGNSSFSGSKQPMTNSTANRSRTKCPLDQQDRYIGKGPHFLSLDASRRNSEAKKNLLCFNCLSASHAAKNCTSKVLFRHCNGKHHSLLHKDTTKIYKIDRN